MKSPESRSERLPDISFVPPAVESFFNADEAKKTWPEHIVNDPVFREQIETQRRTLESFRSIVDTIPLGMNIDEALQRNHVDEKKLSEFYDRLADYLERDPANTRLVLYFPLELLTPPLAAPHSPELNTHITRCNDAYQKAWEAQLGFHEVRANFVDGDVLEEELRQRDHPRVVKATHLIPGLVARGIITVAEAIGHAESSEDQLLKDGVLDACEVMVDKSLMTADDIERLRQSSDPYLRSGANFLPTPGVNAQSDAPEPRPFAAVESELNERLKNIAAAPEDSTPARTAWLRTDAREKTITTYARELAAGIAAGHPPPPPHTLSPEVILASVEALRQASLQDPEVYTRHRVWLDAVEQTGQADGLNDALTKLYAHLNAAGVISTEELAQRGVRIPKLTGPFSENLKPIEPFLRDVKRMSAAIERDSYLEKYVYPATLVFGSQLKGYGTQNADADVAVFVRPGTDRTERAQIEQRLSVVFNHEKIGGKAVLFWLDATETGLTVHDWPERAASDGNSSWVHVLFGAAWEGKRDSIRELRHKLLTTYFYDPGTELEGKPTRERWFEEMERDTLQYRLLHKGFGRYYPIKSPMDTPHGDAIDGKSAFYDPRYRRIATELYLSRVFLPKLKR